MAAPSTPTSSVIPWWYSYQSSDTTKNIVVNQRCAIPSSRLMRKMILSLISVMIVRRGRTMTFVKRTSRRSTSQRTTRMWLLQYVLVRACQSVLVRAQDLGRTFCSTYRRFVCSCTTDLVWRPSITKSASNPKDLSSSNRSRSSSLLPIILYNNDDRIQGVGK